MAPAHFDAAAGTLDASIFSAPAIHDEEQASLFRRHWLFLGPARWASEAGGYFTTLMGETPVIAWRGADGLGVFVNRCLGGDMPLATELRGHAERLRCACHGWSYAPVAAAGAAAPDAVPRVEEHAGLLFGCFDPGAPPLAERLGDFALYAGAIVESLPGGIAVAGDRPIVTRLAANWKLAAEAFGGDLYREMTVARATREALGDAAPTRGFQAAAGAGAVVMAEAADGQGAADGPLAGMRPVSATLFPNLSYDGRAQAFHVWQPRGARAMEMWTYPLIGRADSAETAAARLRTCRLVAGLDTDDLAPVWMAATAASRGLVAGTHRLNLQMGLGRERPSNLPGAIADLISESNQRHFYAWWQRELARQGEAPPRRRRLRVVRPDTAEPHHRKDLA